VSKFSGCTKCGPTTANYATCTFADLTAWLTGTPLPATPGTTITAVTCATSAFFKSSATFGTLVESCRSCTTDTTLKAGDGAATIFG